MTCKKRAFPRPPPDIKRQRHTHPDPPVKFDIAADGPAAPREQFLKELDSKAATCAAACSNKISTTSSAQHDSTPALDPLVINPGRDRSNEERIRMKLELDWAVSYDPPLSPARAQAGARMIGSTVFHSPYFSSASDATAWADSAGWPWREGECRQRNKWQEEPQMEEEGFEENTSSPAPTMLPSRECGRDLEKGEREEQCEGSKKPEFTQAAHHRKPCLSYSDVVQRP
ncbi:hypothetical protein F5Y05DRAFT_423792 [Hypoxylon sp. FL0543]|nr:hypothetical protein F5Y05DRAFT_423792 [Hypoxylon sp. FL0543]